MAKPEYHVFTFAQDCPKDVFTIKSDALDYAATMILNDRQVIIVKGEQVSLPDKYLQRFRRQQEKVARQKEQAMQVKAKIDRKALYDELKREFEPPKPNGRIDPE